MSLASLDIAISNAGAPYQGPIGDSTALLRQSFELNFFAHQYVSAGAVRVFMKQNQILCPGAPLMGGCLLFNTSKASVNPGPNFGPYAIAKAATLALMKQYALEYGVHQIRSNAVNADRVRTSFFSAEVVEKRAQSRGLTPEQYFANNLLKHEVTAEVCACLVYDTVFEYSLMDSLGRSACIPGPCSVCSHISSDTDRGRGQYRGVNALVELKALCSNQHFILQRGTIYIRVVKTVSILHFCAFLDAQCSLGLAR